MLDEYILQEKLITSDETFFSMAQKQNANVSDTEESEDI
jgi:hypothetical protein